jgi:hypothetical protein
MLAIPIAGASGMSLGPAPARSMVPDPARQAYRAGRWLAVADAISDPQDPDQLAFAARSLLAGAVLDNRHPNRASHVGRARALALSAIKIAPSHVEGRLQLATALGLQTRMMSPARAFASGLPNQIRRILEAVVQDAPREAWAFALTGGWHLEALRIGGVSAQTMIGASLRKGKAAFARAMELDGTEPAVPFYYAAALIAINPAAHAQEARTLVRRVEPMTGEDAFQSEIKARAQKLAQTIDRDGPAQGAALAVSWL